MNDATKNIINLIDRARVRGDISNAAASAASYCLTLTGDDAEIANRVVARGSDPLSLELLTRGEASDKVRAAHYGGPGVYSRDDPERMHYLALCAFSADESKETTLTQRVVDLAQSLLDLGALSEDQGIGILPRADVVASDEEDRIMGTPVAEVEIGGVRFPVGTSDRVFAKAYWSGQPAAGVYHVHPVEGPGVLVGCDGTTLEALGIKPDKLIKPDLGVFTHPSVLEEAARALRNAGIEVPE